MLDLLQQILELDLVGHIVLRPVHDVDVLEFCPSLATNWPKLPGRSHGPEYMNSMQLLLAAVGPPDRRSREWGGTNAAAIIFATPGGVGMHCGGASRRLGDSAEEPARQSELERLTTPEGGRVPCRADASSCPAPWARSGVQNCALPLPLLLPLRPLPLPLPCVGGAPALERRSAPRSGLKHLAH